MSRFVYIRYAPLPMVLIGILYLLVPFSISGQDPRFKKLTLSVPGEEQQYHCLFQDTEGLLWLGTSRGLYTFDGSRLSYVSLPDSIQRKGITAFWQDSGNRYWLGLESGDVFRFDGRASLDPILFEKDLDTQISTFLEDNIGRIWIGTYGQGAWIVQEDQIRSLNSDNGLSDDYIYTMVTGPEGKIWMGTDNGINLIDTSMYQKKHPFNIQHIGLEEGLPDLIVLSLNQDSDGRIWIGMHNGGITMYDPLKEKFIPQESISPWSYGPVLDLLAAGNSLWIVTARQGIVEFNYNSGVINKHSHFREDGLTRVKSIMKDKEDNLWFLGLNELWMSFANKLRFIENVGNTSIRNIHALIVDPYDRLWYANDQGVFSFHIHQPVEPPFLKHHPVQIDLKTQKVMSLYYDAWDHLWIGTFGQGVIRMDHTTGKQQTFGAADGLENGNILSIDGNKHEIWFGTLGGAYRMATDIWIEKMDSKPKFEHFGREEGLVNNYIYQVILTKDGTPYFATDGNGVFIFKDGHFTNILDTTSGAKNVVYSIDVDTGGDLWINRANEGLMHYNGKRYERINAQDAHNGVVFSGILHNRNELVMVYNEGIDIMNLYEGSIRHYESNAGIEAINPDLNTIAADSNGNVWIGTAKGIIQYRPPKELVLDHPITRLNHVSLFLEPIITDDRKQFDYHENHFTFSYSGLWYQYPEKVEFLVKLEGHDLNWIKTRNNRVVYSDLKPGHYTFRVKSGIYGNYQDSNEASYSFTIQNPFYQSWLFYVLLASFTILFIWWIIRQRIARVKRREEIIQERIRYQFENLKSQLNPHFLFNSFSTLIALIEDNSREAVKYVEELSNLFRVVLEYKDLDMISLEQECRLADNYIRLQKRRFGENLHVSIRKNESFHYIKIPPLTLQLLIENAIKHNIVSQENPLSVEIYIDSAGKSIFVENNIQIKKDGATSMGIGIKNIVNRYKLLTDRKVEVTDEGSVFRIALPII